MTVDVAGFFDEATSSVSYVVADAGSGRCAVIDPVLGYDARSGRISRAPLEPLAAHIRGRGLTVEWVLDTHVHADHFTAMAEARDMFGGRTGIGAHVSRVQRIFAEIYNLDSSFPADGSQFDRLFADGESFAIGGVPVRVMHVPGHTPACVAYLIGDAVFVGDTLLMPDFGTARCDFPGGDAAALYASVRRILALPPETRLFVAHDYAPGGRAFAWETTVAAQRAENLHVRDGISPDEFVALRRARDATLELPALMLPALQVNIRAGVLPAAESNGLRYLRIPLNRF